MMMVNKNITLFLYHFYFTFTLKILYDCHIQIWTGKKITKLRWQNCKRMSKSMFLYNYIQQLTYFFLFGKIMAHMFIIAPYNFYMSYQGKNYCNLNMSIYKPKFWDIYSYCYVSYIVDCKQDFLSNGKCQKYCRLSEIIRDISKEINVLFTIFMIEYNKVMASTIKQQLYWIGTWN